MSLSQDPRSSTTVQHSGLSTTFLGVDRRDLSSGNGPDLRQYNGIKYGNIPARFHQATLNEDFPEILDVTSYGPKSPQIILSPGLEDSLVGTPQSNAPQNAENIFDEFECLNLNIITPHDATGNSNLPVLLYIHGGGGHYGSNSDWIRDGGPIVSLSREIGRPVVHVAINYRLSVFGQLGSAELQAENGKRNGGNFAYHDMVHKHIRPFGGSPSKITIYGESFGSIAVESQLHSNLPARFSRAILQSEVLDAPLFSIPDSLASKSASYEALKLHLGLTTLQQLLDVPAQTLLEAYAIVDHRARKLPFVPIIDEVFFGEDWRETLNFAGGKKGSVIIRNTSEEGSVVRLLTEAAPKIAPPPTKTLIDALLLHISKEKLEVIQTAYSILDSPVVSLSQLKINILTIVEDMMWYAPTPVAIANLQKLREGQETPEIYQYSFEQLNLFNGPYTGVANHALDLAYLHGNPRIFQETENPAAEKNIETQIKTLWIMFANGQSPWKSDKVMQFGPNGVNELDGRTFLEFRKCLNWKSLEGLTIAEKEAVAVVLMTHLIQLSGVA